MSQPRSGEPVFASIEPSMPKLPTDGSTKFVLVSHDRHSLHLNDNNFLNSRFTDLILEKKKILGFLARDRFFIRRRVIIFQAFQNM